ncbi:ABC transporter permease [Streptomyces colonosanans]|uniref:ABC transporter permease n=1 Tax=Streptomyces colonosanans TaxID=1428652 RepID=A0A1S2Q210_9ACTN|nr:ABC transporter permease [Streptomyces colonosanans]OIJ99625.1 ABC transporter permease [Streptomyces colonosanans]
MSTYQIAGALRGGRRRVAVADPVMTAAGCVVALVVLVALLAPLIAPYDPNAVDPAAVYAGPSGAHWLGTDDTGRDILSRLIHGARPSLIAPAAVVLLATAAGTTLAIAAAWAGGWVDRVISGVLDVIFGFPGLIMAVVAATIFGPGLLVPVLAMSIAYVPLIARVLRNSALKERNLPYIAALQLLGTPTWRIWLRHLLPNLLPIVTVQATVGFGYALLDIAAISFIGLGAQPPQAEWGLMVSSGYPGILSGQAGQVLYSGITIVVIVIAFNLLGSGLSRKLLGEGL